MQTESCEAASKTLALDQQPETAAHGRRVTELARRMMPLLPVPSPVPADRVLEVCEEFDQAVEFAAFEGRSIPAALAEFFEENPGPEYGLLPRIAGGDLSVPSLPVMPKAASRLLRTSDEMRSLPELESLAASDPALAGRLLGAVNSAQFGSRFKITRLRDAIMRLGVPQTRQVLLASCFAGLFASKALKEVWEHSQTVAAAAAEIAPLCGMDTETAYVAGLLHDIGRLGLLMFPASRQVAEGEWLAAGFPRVYAETLVYGRDHAAFGAQILSGWDLAEEIVAAVALHHRPELGSTRLSAVIYLAEDRLLAADDWEDLWRDMRREAAFKSAGITLEQLAERDFRRALQSRASG